MSITELNTVTIEISEDRQVRAISPSGGIVAIEGENNTSKLIINMPSAYAEYDKYIEFESKAYNIGKFQSPILGEGKVSFEYQLPAQVLVEGLLVAQIVCKRNDNVWKSNCFPLLVGPGINATEFIIEANPDIIQDLRERMKTVEEDADLIEQNKIESISAKEAAELARDDARQYSENAEVHSDIAIAQTNIAIEQAQSASLNKDAIDANAVIIENNKKAVIQDKEDVTYMASMVFASEQRVIQLMSTDTKSYFFSTIMERDDFAGFKNCDRCSVFETRSDYIYDTSNVDNDNENPEWILTSQWDALKTVAWDIISGKPNFANVAFSGSYIDLIDQPNRYESFITLDYGDYYPETNSFLWDYSVSDKVIITLASDAAIDIINTYNGAVGFIKVYGGYPLTLPVNSTTSIDFDYVTALSGEHYLYSFIYDGAKFLWTRTVCK